MQIELTNRHVINIPFVRQHHVSEYGGKFTPLFTVFAKHGQRAGGRFP
ncbi:hypothetical protein [Achromobacter sp. DMS1]|nr:hypothetical protein [Achromobacter sp. DMS1]